ncbi:MAG: phosphoribosylglycinamide formyltransferase [Dehalococcoidia bacterium]|nr:phosphoribosylglycinamide formyltransferase [Dehalococcoidia bacterium]
MAPKDRKLPLGVLASHGGTNLQAIIDACADGSLDAEIRVVISNNSRAMALERARRSNIPTAHLSSVTHPDPARLDAVITDTLTTRGVELVALAGYMRKLGPRTLSRYRNRILNVHPALLPKFGGRGMYGERVHAAVLTAGESVSGVSVHLVDEEYDRGPVIAQAEVPVLPNDTPDTLAARVLEQEHVLYPQTIQRIASGEIDLDGLA